MRIAICTNFVSPYRRPVFRALAEQTDADVQVFASADSEADRAWKIQSNCHEPFGVVKVPGITRAWTKRTTGVDGFTQRLERHYPIGLPRALADFEPDVVISGELGPRTLAAMIYGASTGTPVIPWAYPSIAQADRPRATTLMQRMILRNAPCVVGMGSQARVALKKLGMHDERIIDAPNAADAHAIARRLVDPKHSAAVQSIRHGEAGRRIAVVVGRLVPMKGIQRLVDASNALDEDIRENWRLVFVGDGPLRSSIERQTDESVKITGHVDPECVPDWLVAADLHIFASLGDPWGLVVNEAMQCGTPTLCSSLAGCCDDLVVHHGNGFRFTPAAETADFHNQLRDALLFPDKRRLGERARLDVGGFTPWRMAGSFRDAIEMSKGLTGGAIARSWRIAS